MNPVDEFLELKKQADGAALGIGALKSLKDIPRILGTGAALAAGAGGMQALGAGAENLYNAATKGRAMRQLVSQDPELQEHYREKPQNFNRMFSALYTMNPDFAREPVVAGTYMRRMLAGGPEGAGGVAVEAFSQQAPKRPGPVTDAMGRGFQQGAGMRPPEGPRPSGKTKTVWEGREAPERREEETIHYG